MNLAVLLGVLASQSLTRNGEPLCRFLQLPIEVIRFLLDVCEGPFNVIYVPFVDFINFEVVESNSDLAL